jgi:hypothetical protein
MLILVLSFKVGSIVSTLSLFLEREIISSHLKFESIVGYARIRVIIRFFGSLESLTSFSSLFRLVWSKMEVRFLKNSSLSVKCFLVICSLPVLSMSINIVSISSLVVTLGLSKTELGRLHFRLKLSSVSGRVCVVNSIFLMSSISVSNILSSVIT